MNIAFKNIEDTAKISLKIDKGANKYKTNLYYNYSLAIVFFILKALYFKSISSSSLFFG
jgi:hypothetical protein